MPNLLTLNIEIKYSRFYVVSDLSPVFMEFMPRLQNLRCPVFMAQYLIPGRPLKNVDVYRFGISKDNEASALLHLFQLSTASIRQLRVPTFVYLESPREFANTFPDLDELTLTFGSQEIDSVGHLNSSAITLINLMSVCVAADGQRSD
jgi:hypothetical protein